MERDYLGHTFRVGYILCPQTESAGRILQIERPKAKQQCQCLLGMLRFYRRYTPNSAEIFFNI